MTDAGRHQIGLILFPRLTQLDLTGPFEVLARLPNADVHLVWKVSVVRYFGTVERLN